MQSISARVMRLLLVALGVACAVGLNTLAPELPATGSLQEHGFAAGYSQGFALAYKRTHQLADQDVPTFLELSSSVTPMFDEYSDPQLLDATIPKSRVGHHSHHKHAHHAHGARPEPDQGDLEESFLSHYVQQAAGTRPAPMLGKPAPKPHLVKRPSTPVARRGLPAGLKPAIHLQEAHEGSEGSEEHAEDPATAATDANNAGNANATSADDNARRIEEQEKKIADLESKYEQTHKKLERYEEQREVMTAASGTDSNGKTEFIKGYEGGFKVGYEAGWNMATADLKKRYGFPEHSGNSEYAEEIPPPNVAQSNNTLPANATAGQVVNNAVSNNNNNAMTNPVANNNANPVANDNANVNNDNAPSNEGRASNFFTNNMFRGEDGQFQNPFANGNNPFRSNSNEFQQQNNNPFFNNNAAVQETLPVQPMQMQFQPQFQQQQFAAQDQQQFQQPQFQQQQQFQPMQQAPQMGMFNTNLQAQQQQQPQGMDMFGSPQNQGLMGLPQKAMSFFNNIKGMIQEGRNTVEAVRDALRPDGQQQPQQFAPQQGMQQFAPQQGMQQMPFMNLMQTEQGTNNNAGGGDLLGSLASLLGGQNANTNNHEDLGLTNLAQLLAQTNPSSAAPKPVVAQPGQDSAALGLQEMQNMIQEGQHPVA